MRRRPDTRRCTRTPTARLCTRPLSPPSSPDPPAGASKARKARRRPRRFLSTRWCSPSPPAESRRFVGLLHRFHGICRSLDSSGNDCRAWRDGGDSSAASRSRFSATAASGGEREEERSQKKSGDDTARPAPPRLPQHDSSPSPFDLSRWLLSWKHAEAFRRNSHCPPTAVVERRSRVQRPGFSRNDDGVHGLYRRLAAEYSRCVALPSCRVVTAFPDGNSAPARSPRAVFGPCHMTLCFPASARLKPHPRWCPLTSPPPRPLTPGGNTSGSTAAGTRTGRRWWRRRRPERRGPTSGSLKQVTARSGARFSPLQLLTDAWMDCCFSRRRSRRGDVVLSLPPSESGELGQLPRRHPAIQHAPGRASLVGPGRRTGETSGDG